MAPPRDPDENSGRRLTPLQIAAVAWTAGFQGQDIAIATAVAMAESGGGDVTAVGRAKPERPDYGLWQINYIHKDSGGRMPSDFFPPGTKWKDARVNGEVANDIYARAKKKFTDWTVFNEGTYGKYLGEAGKALDTLTADPGGIVSIIREIADLGQIEPRPDDGSLTPDTPGGDIIDGVQGLYDFFVDGGWKKIAWIAGGVVAVILGLLLLYKDQLPTGKLASIAAKVAK